MSINIRGAVRNCEIKEAQVQRFDLEKVKGLVTPLSLFAVGAAVPFIPGIESVMQPTLDATARVIENTGFLMEHRPGLIKGVSSILGGVGAMLTVVGFLECRDNSSYKAKTNRLIMDGVRSTWKALASTNDNLSTQLSGRQNWLSKALSDKSSISTDVLAKYGLDKNDRAAMVDLQRAYLYGVKNAVVKAANRGIDRDLNTTVDTPSGQRDIAAGMLSYYESKSTKLGIISTLRNIVGLEVTTPSVDVSDLGQAGLAAIRDLQVALEPQAIVKNQRRNATSDFGF